MIFGITLGAMAVGMAVLSINSSDDAKEAGNNKVVEGSNNVNDNDPSATPETTPEASENPVATNPLEKNKYSEVNAVVETYLKASVAADMTTFSSVVSEAEQISKEDLERWYEYVEEIKNVDCYTIASVDEDSYFVYVYYEMKLVNIETLAPGLIQLYVTKTSDDNYVILISQLDDMLKEARDLSLQRQDVKDLITNVNNKLSEAASKDAKLKEFVQKLQDSTNQATQPTEAPTATTDPTATKAPTATAVPGAAAPATTAPTNAPATTAPTTAPAN